MNKLFDSVWALRIVALVLAFALFFYVKSSLDGGRESNATNDVEILYNVPVEVYYDNENLIVTGVPETVNVTISGAVQHILQAQTSQDYVVFVDLNSLTLGEHHVPIKHENFSDKLNVSIEPASVQVVIEEKVSKEFKVEPEMNSRLIAEDYVLKDMTANPETVTVTGAKSVVDSVSYIKATVTGEQGMSGSFEQDANVKVLNMDLNRLDVTVEPAQVKVKVEIEQYSKEIPITIQESGTLPEGVTINKLLPEPKHLKVTGERVMIDELTELVVKFDVSDLSESGSYEGKVIVPEGVAVEKGTVKIHADVNVNIANNN